MAVGGRLTSPNDRQKTLQIPDEGVADDAKASELALLLGVGLTTLQRWRHQFAGNGDGIDRRKGSLRHVAHRFSEEERQRILLICNEPDFAALPPPQIVPIPADRSPSLGSELSFYRVLYAHGQAHRRGRAWPPQEPRLVPRLRTSGPNQMWSWDITSLPTTVSGVLQYLYLVIDGWSRKVVAWDYAEREAPGIAADLVSSACLIADQQGPDAAFGVAWPITTTPCMQPCWRARWRNWGCSGRSRGRASATTTRTPYR